MKGREQSINQYLNNATGQAVSFFTNSLLTTFTAVTSNRKINAQFMQVISTGSLEINISKSKRKNLEEYWISNLNYPSRFCNARQVIGTNIFFRKITNNLKRKFGRGKPKTKYLSCIFNSQNIRIDLTCFDLKYCSVAFLLLQCWNVSLLHQASSERFREQITAGLQSFSPDT